MFSPKLTSGWGTGRRCSRSGRTAAVGPGVFAVLTATALDATGIGSVSVPAPVFGELAERVRHRVRRVKPRPTALDRPSADHRASDEQPTLPIRNSTFWSARAAYSRRASVSWRDGACAPRSPRTASAGGGTLRNTAPASGADRGRPAPV